jgi:Asp-tRNA(Asn)/Glu-tRNA(Gln) amidotransferase B subunit
MTGRVIGLVMKAAGGTVDGTLVNRLVREELGSA